MFPTWLSLPASWPPSIRITGVNDLDFVLQTEQHYENKDFILGWSLEQHKTTLADADKVHIIIETLEKNRVGYAILAGLKNSNKSVELVRIVITDKSKGYGKTAIKLIQEYVLENLNLHRLWLDVKENNVRARIVYNQVGFIEEGVLRECLIAGDQYESLVIMSILQSEYRNKFV